MCTYKAVTSIHAMGHADTCAHTHTRTQSNGNVQRKKGDWKTGGWEVQGIGVDTVKV